MDARIWSGVAIAMAVAGVAAAQEAQAPATAPVAKAEGPVVYDAAWYARFSPRTALDMIGRTPGFTLIEGEERRGFSGAVGNILIDGQRSSAKSQTLVDILQRIPAAQVLRIEILRGGETAGDASGQAVLANVVRTPFAGGGVWSVGAEFAAQHKPAPNAWASWSGRLGVTDYALGASGYSLLRELPGERSIIDGGGDVVATREDRSPRAFHEIAVNGEAGRAVLGGRVRLTGQAYHSRYHEDSTILTHSPSGVRLEEEFNPYTESKRTLESGVHYERGLGAWDLTLAGLLTRTRFASDVSSTHRNAASEIDAVFTQTLVRDSGESILRASVARELSPAHRLEAGVEGAFNTLDATLDLTLDLGGGPFPIRVPNSNLLVEEGRGDAFLAHTWRLNPRWSVETRLAGEASRLSFTGDTDQSVDLLYLKPSLQITRALGARNQLRLRIYRDVSQLDFNDFVSAASVADDIITGGNPDLRPQTSWRAEAALDLRFGAQGALGLTLFHHRLQDAVDLVPVGPAGARFDAPGNIGEGEVSGLKLTLTAPLAPLIPGGVFTLDATFRDAKVTDPLTGERRTISEFEERQIKAEFRQDLPARKLTWGANYKGNSERISFRLNEVDTRRDSPSLDLFIETTAIPRVKVRLTAVSLLGSPELRERVFHAPDRTGPVREVERSERHPGRWLLLTMSGKF